MKQLNLFGATLLLTSLALLPAMAGAQDLDDLEVTMEVVDDLAGIGDVVAEMPGPEMADGDALTEDGSDESGDAESNGESGQELTAEDERFDKQDDRFVIDDDFSEDNDGFAEEGDFEEGEDIDDDRYDIEMPADDDMEEVPLEDEVV
jgi:hypothetical protein